MIGSACALALARKGLSVIVFDKYAAHQDTLLEPQRVSAINQASENILRNLSVWAGIAVSRPQPFERIEVWDAENTGTISFDAANMGLAHLGHIVRNNTVSSALHQALTSEPDVSLRFGDTPVAITSSGSSIAVELERGEIISARLLIGADGANSKVRELADITHQESAYGHTAIVATVTPEAPHDSCARQRFLSSGPLAFLPLADNECSIVWSTHTDRAEELLPFPWSLPTHLRTAWATFKRSVPGRDFPSFAAMRLTTLAIGLRLWGMLLTRCTRLRALGQTRALPMPRRLLRW